MYIQTTHPVLFFGSVRAVQGVSDRLLLVSTLLPTTRCLPSRQHFFHYRASRSTGNRAKCNIL